MSPKISVIVPYYNSNLFRFRRLLESVLSQSFTDFELLVVIDGSKQKYQHIQEDLESKDKRVKFFVQKNAGVSAARNLGIERSSGEYIAFVDSDDFLEDSFLSHLYKAIQGYDIAICGIDEQHYPTITMKMDRRVFFSLPAEYCWLQYTNFSVNKLYRAEIIRSHHIRFQENVRLGEDALFLADYFQYCKSFSLLDERLYHYIPNCNSATNTFLPEYWNWEQQVIDLQWKLYTQYPLTKREEEFLYYWLFIKFKGALFYYISNDYRCNDLDVYLERITSNNYFKLLLQKDVSVGEFFSKNMIRVLKLWRYSGVFGVKLFYKLRYKPSIVNNFANSNREHGDMPPKATC